jgi:hypothetical protein
MNGKHGQQGHGNRCLPMFCACRGQLPGLLPLPLQHSETIQLSDYANDILEAITWTVELLTGSIFDYHPLESIIPIFSPSLGRRTLLPIQPLIARAMNDDGETSLQGGRREVGPPGVYDYRQLWPPLDEPQKPVPLPVDMSPEVYLYTL